MAEVVSVAAPLQPLLLGGAGAWVLLSVQGLSPYFGWDGAPSWVNWALAVLCWAAWATLSYFGRWQHRLATVVSSLSALYLLSQTAAFHQPSSAHLASVLSAQLSATYAALPLPALLCGWSILCAGFLLHEAILAALPTRTSGWTRALSISVAASTCAFGVNAVIGYASGTPLVG
jgi:hypothetical protein